MISENTETKAEAEREGGVREGRGRGVSRGRSEERRR